MKKTIFSLLFLIPASLVSAPEDEQFQNAKNQFDQKCIFSPYSHVGVYPTVEAEQSGTTTTDCQRLRVNIFAEWEKMRDRYEHNCEGTLFYGIPSVGSENGYTGRSCEEFRILVRNLKYFLDHRPQPQG